MQPGKQLPGILLLLLLCSSNLGFETSNNSTREDALERSIPDTDKIPVLLCFPVLESPHQHYLF